MKSSLFLVVGVSLLGCLAITSCGPQKKDANVLSVPKVVIALKPDKNPDAMLTERESLAAMLSKDLDIAVEVIVPLASAVIQEGMANGTIDLGYLSATDLVKAKEKGVADLLLAGEINGGTTYQSYWVSLKDKPYTKVEDLKGLKVAFSSKTSTSGMTIPVYDLHKKGLIGAEANPEEFFGPGNVFYGTGYVSAVEQVLTGQAEAAAVSYYVLDLDKHLTEGQRSTLKKVTEQGPVPTHVIAVRSSLPEADRTRIKKVLLKLNEPEYAPLRDRVFTSKLVETDYQQHVRDLPEAVAYVTGKIK